MRPRTCCTKFSHPSAVTVDAKVGDGLDSLNPLSATNSMFQNFLVSAMSEGFFEKPGFVTEVVCFLAMAKCGVMVVLERLERKKKKKEWEC